MRMAKSWCCLFTTSALAVGGAVYSTIAAGAACKDKFLNRALEQFEGNFHLPSFNFNASMSSGVPAMGFDFRNVTGPASQFLTPSMLQTINDLAEDAGRACEGISAEQYFIAIVLAAGSIGMGIYLQGQINALKSASIYDDEPVYTPVSTYR